MPGLPRKTRCCVVATSEQPRLLAAGLHAQERDERPHLLLDRLEPRQRVELRKQLVERASRLLAPEQIEIELFADLGAQLLAERLQRLEGILGTARTRTRYLATP